MAATFNKFNYWAEICLKGVNLASDTMNIMLTNTAPVATNNTYLLNGDLSTGNGYTLSGASLTLTTNSQTGGTYTMAANQVTWTASGGTIGPFRYVILYDLTTSGGPNCAWWDYGSSITLQIGETFTVQFNSANPGNVFQLS